MSTLFSSYNEEHKDIRSSETDFKIQQQDNRFGVVHSATQRLVIPCDYDNIFRYGPDLFALCKHGKWGAVRLADDIIDWIAPCEYDTLDTNYDDLIFSKGGELRYYFSGTRTTKSFKEMDFVGPYRYYIFAIDDNSYYIIRSYDGTVLWTCSKNDKRINPWGHPCGDPCLVYLGEKDGLPVFFDCTNSNYIVPGKDGKLTFAPYVPNMIMPVIVNDRHIITITDEEGIKVGDFDESFNQDIGAADGFDEVTVEIKVTLKGKNRTEERYYPLPNGTVIRGEVRELGTWNLSEY